MRTRNLPMWSAALAAVIMATNAYADGARPSLPGDNGTGPGTSTQDIIIVPDGDYCRIGGTNWVLTKDTRVVVYGGSIHIAIPYINGFGTPGDDGLNGLFNGRSPTPGESGTNGFDLILETRASPFTGNPGGGVYISVVGIDLRGASGGTGGRGADGGYTISNGQRVEFIPAQNGFPGGDGGNGGSLTIQSSGPVEVSAGAGGILLSGGHAGHGGSGGAYGYEGGTSHPNRTGLIDKPGRGGYGGSGGHAGSFRIIQSGSADAMTSPCDQYVEIAGCTFNGSILALGGDAGSGGRAGYGGTQIALAGFGGDGGNGGEVRFTATADIEFYGDIEAFGGWGNFGGHGSSGGDGPDCDCGINRDSPCGGATGGLGGEAGRGGSGGQIFLTAGASVMAEQSFFVVDGGNAGSSAGATGSSTLSFGTVDERCGCVSGSSPTRATFGTEGANAGSVSISGTDLHLWNSTIYALGGDGSYGGEGGVGENCDFELSGTQGGAGGNGGNGGAITLHATGLLDLRDADVTTCGGAGGNGVDGSLCDEFGGLGGAAGAFGPLVHDAPPGMLLVDGAQFSFCPLDKGTDGDDGNTNPCSGGNP